MGRNPKKEYSQEIISLDFEVTSLVSLDGETWGGFDEKIHGGQEYDRQGVLYAWGSYRDTVYSMGRDYQSLEIYLNSLSSVFEWKIIWVHNLSYEFQFLRNIFPEMDVFARKPRKPMKFVIEDLKLEFRCTYFLTNLSLAKVAEVHSSPETQKKIGDLDYDLIRHPKTALTVLEQEYLRVDNQIIIDLIRAEVDEWGTVKKIPLTSTGKLREELKSRYKNDYNTRKKMVKMNDYTLDDFLFLMKSFQGGYTHANAVHVGAFLEGVTSWDIVSSYPTDMLVEKFPVTKFTPCVVSARDLCKDSRKCHIVHLKLYDIEAKGHNTYISGSKCVKIPKLNPDGTEVKNAKGDSVMVTTVKGGTFDNGRVSSADSLEIICTDIDFLIIKKNYKIKKLQVLKAYEARTGYLPDTLCHYIIELFHKKQDLKGIEGKEYEYMKSKNRLNSLYGMLVTNVITDDVLFKNDVWSVEKITDDEAQSRLDKQNAIYKVSGCYMWGVYVTAYARRKLWYLIEKLGYWLVYSDTDSIKFIGDFNEEIEAYNEKIAEKRLKMCERLGIDFESLGNIGEFEPENKGKSYDKFVTLGAKKYGYEVDGKVTVTISGVPKKSGSKYLSSLEQFKDGFLFGYDCGKKEIAYNEEQKVIKVTDYLGEEMEVAQKYGTTLTPTTYRLGITDDFTEFIYHANNKESVELSQFNTFNELGGQKYVFDE